MVGPLKDNDGLVITRGKEMADALNIYFSSVFTLEDKNNLPVHEPLLADNVECLTNMLITPAMIETKITKLKDNKSPGIDGITPKLLKEIAEEISVPLAIMFNLSLREGTVPHKWKHANVVPLFKKGNRCKAEKLQTGKLNISSMQTPRIITARSYGRYPRKTQFIKGYTARVSEDGRV